MSKSKALTQIDYFHNLVKIKYNTVQRPTKIVLLNEQKCVVSYFTFCLVIVLVGDDEGTYKVVEFNKHIQQLLPHKDGFFVRVGKECFFVDKNNNKTKIKDIQFGVVCEFRYFNTSKEVFEYWKKEDQHGIFNIKDPKVQFTSKNQYKAGVFLNCADQKQLIVSDIGKFYVELFNLNTAEKKRIVLSFTEPVLNFYLVDQNSALVIRKNQNNNCLSLWRTQFGTNIQPYQFEDFSKQNILKINAINPHLNLVLISTSKQSIVYNYKQQNIISRFRSNPFYVSHQIDSKFTNFVQFQFTKSQGLIISHSKALSNPKKLTMHLYTRAGIMDLYGSDSLLQRIVKLTEYAV